MNIENNPFEFCLQEVKLGKGRFFTIQMNPMESNFCWSPDDGTPVMVCLLNIIGSAIPRFLSREQRDTFKEVKELCKIFPGVDRSAAVSDCLK